MLFKSRSIPLFFCSRILWPTVLAVQSFFRLSFSILGERLSPRSPPSYHCPPQVLYLITQQHDGDIDWWGHWDWGARCRGWSRPPAVSLSDGPIRPAAAHPVWGHQPARTFKSRFDVTFTSNHRNKVSIRIPDLTGIFSGKLFSLGHNPSMGSVDSDIGYDMGSVHSDLGLLEDSPSLSEVMPASSSAAGCSPAPFMMARPPNPAMAALTSQHRETHNRSPISFREGRRASDTSLTQGQSQQGSVISSNCFWDLKVGLHLRQKCYIHPLGLLSCFFSSSLVLHTWINWLD